MKTVYCCIFLFVVPLILANCASPEPTIATPVATDTAIPTPTSTPEPLTLGVGFRFSTYGIGSNPGPEYFLLVGSPLSTPITDEEAMEWVKAIRGHNPNYRLFLKHWETEFMPPTYREGIVFIDDGQQYESLEGIERSTRRNW